MSKRTRFWFWVYRWSERLSRYADNRATLYLSRETPTLEELIARDIERSKAQQNTSTTTIDTSAKWMGRQ